MLSELDRVAVRVGHPGAAEIRQEVVRRAERRRTVGGQTLVVAVGIIGPEYDLNRPPTEVRFQSVIGYSGLDRGDADGELVQGYLHVNWCTILGRPEGLAKTETLVESDEPKDIAGVNVDRRGTKHTDTFYQDRGTS